MFLAVATTNCSVEHFEYINDGFCDIHGGYNTAECFFDGGDCCTTTCERATSGNGVKYECRENAYDCLNGTLSLGFVFCYG